MQYSPGLLDAFLAHTGLITNPRSTWNPELSISVAAKNQLI
jgi:hypothetical protein